MMNSPRASPNQSRAKAATTPSFDALGVFDPEIRHLEAEGTSIITGARIR
jgi:hypothetical protein